jgi:phosphoribosyl-AMP cyclohydrolase
LGTWRYVVHWCTSVGCAQYAMRHYLTDSLPFGSLSVFVRCDVRLWAKGKHSQHLFRISRVKTFC